MRQRQVEKDLRLTEGPHLSHPPFPSGNLDRIPAGSLCHGPWAETGSGAKSHSLGETALRWWGGNWPKSHCLRCK